MALNKILWNPISTFWSDDHSRKAIVNVDKNTCLYFIDFFINEANVGTVSYPGKSLYFVEDAAENFTQNILYPDGVINSCT
jgi:hypothetical protein